MREEVQARRQRLQENWRELVPEAEWTLHRPVLEEASRQQIPFAMGGGLTFSAYSGRWRNTKDVDLFVQPPDRNRMIEILARAGFNDYYEQQPYERNWIYRAYKADVIIDIIWKMANHRTEVDEEWVSRGWLLHLGGVDVRLLPAEELLWSKIYVVQRDRCDWPDLLNLLYSYGTELEWDRLISRIGEDTPLLAGLMSIYSWVCPHRSRSLPASVWQRLGLPNPADGPPCDESDLRADLLDTREWFGPREET